MLTEPLSTQKRTSRLCWAAATALANVLAVDAILMALTNDSALEGSGTLPAGFRSKSGSGVPSGSRRRAAKSYVTLLVCPSEPATTSRFAESIVAEAATLPKLDRGGTYFPPLANELST